MLTPRIKNCYLPVLQSSETLVGSAEHQKMNKNSTIEKPWSKVTKKLKLEKKIDLDSLVTELKNSDKTNYVNNYIETEEELGDKRKKIIQDIDIINKHVTRKEIEIRNLKQANAELVETNEELRLVSGEFMKKYKDELREKLVVVKDNQKLASKIQQLAIIKGGSVDDDKKYEMLVATIKDKDNKLIKLTELIAPFRKKVKEHESLRAELTLANGEKKGLMEVNEEIVREIASLNDRHLKAIANKDKQLAMLQEKSSRLMEETKRILEAEKSDFAGQGAKLALEKKRVEELKRYVDAEKMAIEEAKTSLIEEKKSIENSRKSIDEENCVIEDEKRVIDEEWGEIVRKKNQISDTEREISEQVKGLIKENEKAIEDKSELEIELSKAQAELKKTKSDSKLVEQLRNSEDTVEEILKKNEDVIESLHTENRQINLELKKKEHQIDDMNKKLANQEDVLMKSEIKLKEEISFKDGMINDLEFKVSQQKEEHSGVLINNKEEMERLKIKIGVLSNNNKRIRTEEESCNKLKKFKPSDESKEMNVEVKELGNEQETSLVHDNLSSTEAIIEEVGEVPETTDEEEHQPSAIVDVINSQIHDEISLVETKSLHPSEIENAANAESVKLPENDSSKKTDSATDSSALKLIAAMNDFEFLIKSSRDQETIAVQVVAQPEPTKKNVPELDKANELIKQVEDIIGQTKIINIINSAKKSKSIRDVFGDSDDENENEGTNDKSETVKVQKEVENTSTKQTIKVRDMTTICEAKVDKVDSDVIIPTDSGDNSIDITEEDETAKRLALEDVSKLKSQVSDVVQLSLSKFFQIVDGVQTKEDLESLTVSFNKQFTEEITGSYIERHASTAGICMTRDHKRSLVDQIIFYFEIKKSVNMNLRKHIHPSSPQFVILSSELSNQFSKDIMESHHTFNSLTGLALTPDNHQWIGNIINFKLSQSQK